MKKKWLRFSLWNFLLAIVIFVLAFLMYHFVTPDGTISIAFQDEAGKPLVTMLLAVLGVLCLFAGIMGQMVARIFYPDKEE